MPDKMTDQFDKWRIYIPVGDSRVIIEPPADVDDRFDDLWLEVTGNMLQKDKLEIGQLICDKMNKSSEGEG